jgi:hypothetical protein
VSMLFQHGEASNKCWPVPIPCPLSILFSITFQVPVVHSGWTERAAESQYIKRYDWL